jgi:hypothetical protein
MPVTKSSLPFAPSADASLLEIKAAMGDLIERTLSQRIEQLKDAGLTGNDLMRLRRLSVNYQKGHTGYGDERFLWEIMPALENVHITKC